MTDNGLKSQQFLAKSSFKFLFNQTAGTFEIIDTLTNLSKNKPFNADSD